MIWGIHFVNRRYDESPSEEFKVLLLGSANVGKTSLFSKFFSPGDHPFHHRHQHNYITLIIIISIRITITITIIVMIVITIINMLIMFVLVMIIDKEVTLVSTSVWRRRRVE